MDNRVYIDFAYTRHERIFEVLIYWIDIESHSRHPEMILMVASVVRVYVRVSKVGFLYVSIDWYEDQHLVSTHCCDLH